MHMVQMLRARSLNLPWGWFSQWSFCIHLISYMRFQVSHIHHNANTFVDTLSSPVVQLQEIVWWDDILSFCRSFLVNDMSGHSVYRFY